MRSFDRRASVWYACCERRVSVAAMAKRIGMVVTLRVALAEVGN